MPDCVAAALRSHRARQSEQRLAAGKEWQDQGLVFATRKGTPVEPRRLDAEFKRLLRKAGLSNSIRLHDSRHFAASLLLAQGTHPRTVMEILGHSDISLTLNTYSHVVPEVMREAAEKIDGALGVGRMCRTTCSYQFGCQTHELYALKPKKPLNFLVRPLAQTDRAQDS
jgi:integrase